MRRKLLGGILLGALSLTVNSNASAQTSFNASIWMPPSHPLARTGYAKWAQALEEATNGELRPVVFTGASLLPPSAHLSGLQDGIAQVTYHTGTYTPSELPEDNVISALSIGMPDMIVAGFAVSDFYMNDPQMQARFDALDIVFTGAQSTSQYNLICTSEVKGVDDLRGLRLRMPSMVHSEWARSVGAVPVSVPSSEMFTGLERGQLDCAANAANDLKSRSLWDVADYVNLVPLGPYIAGWMWAYNKEFWSEISDENRRHIFNTNAKYLVESFLDYENESQAALREAEQHAVSVVEPAEDLMSSVSEFSQHAAYELAYAEAERLGVADAEDLLNRFSQTVEKWELLLNGVDRTDAASLERILRENLYDEINPADYGN